LFERPERLFGPAQLPECCSQIVPAVGVARVQCDGFAEASCRLVETLSHRMDAPQIRVRARILRGEFAGLSARANGIDVTVCGRKQQAQVPLRASVRWIARECRFREIYRLLARASIDCGLKLRQ